jgi:hypothetical protein
MRHGPRLRDLHASTKRPGVEAPGLTKALTGEEQWLKEVYQKLRRGKSQVSTVTTERESMVHFGLVVSEVPQKGSIEEASRTEGMPSGGKSMGVGMFGQGMSRSKSGSQGASPSFGRFIN